VVSVTDPYGRILGFSRQEPLLFYQVAPQLYSQGCVDPVPDPPLFFVVPGNRTRYPWSPIRYIYLFIYLFICACFCGLVRVLGYRSGGPGSIPVLPEKKSSGSGMRSTQPREYN
jgi:hypothetical protein